MKRTILVTLLVLCFACSNEDTPSSEPTLREQIAQMLMVGFRGTEITSEMQIAVQDVKVGGVILFEYDAIALQRPRNITSKEQLTNLVTSLKGLSEYKLLVSIDQEGGNVSRLKETYGYPSTVTAQYLGEVNNPDTTSLYIGRIAEMVSESGFNMNNAPCVDLNVNPTSPAIGARGRSFSANPEVVTNFATAFYDSQMERGVISALKHFPGHGSAVGDSHKGFTDVTDTWSESELIPYRNMIAKGKCDVIMTSHVYNAKLDTLPATLSKKVLTNLLRGEMGFDGVIISDDMFMAAISQNWSFEDAIFRAIDAGVDILIFSNNQGEYHQNIAVDVVDIIERMVISGRLSADRIKASYNRIQHLRSKI